MTDIPAQTSARQAATTQISASQGQLASAARANTANVAQPNTQTPPVQSPSINNSSVGNSSVGNSSVGNASLANSTANNQASPPVNTAQPGQTSQLNQKSTAGSQIQAITQQLQNQTSLRLTVSSVQVLDAKAQQRLAQVNPELGAQIQQAQSQSPSPSTTQNTNQNSPLLYLVKLAQNTASSQATGNQTTHNSTANTSALLSNSLQTQGQASQGQAPLTGANKLTTLLTTVTNTALTPGDQLQLQRNGQGQIIISPSTTGLKATIAEGLKASLPLAQNISPLAASASAVQALPNTLKSLLLSPSTAQALQAISQTVANPQGLAHPTQLQQVISNSGLFTENKLQTQTSLQGDTKQLLGELVASLQAQSHHQGLVHQTTNHAGQTQALDQLLAQLFAKPARDAAKALGTNPLPTLARADTSHQASPQAQALGQLLQLLGLKTTPENINDSKKLREAVNYKLLQMASGAQEKIQLNQLRAFHDSPGESHFRTQNLEIPLRWGEQVLPLQLSIKEKKYSNNSQEEHQSDDKKTTRRWQAFLSFDLPGDRPGSIEQLHSQLTVIEDHVSATLWTSSNTLCKKAKDQLEQLRLRFIAKGLAVDDLHCIQGEPPKQGLSLDYNLVDIRT